MRCDFFRGRDSSWTCLLVAILVHAGVLSSVHAQLTWKQQTIEITPDPKASLVEASFPFTNDGPAAVDIERIDTSCGCTTAKLDQLHYAPGQGGTLVVHYAIGDHVGLQRKDVIVSYVNQAEPQELTLVAHLPEVLRLEPKLVSWKPGEPSATKTIKISTSPADLRLDELTVQASNTRVAAVLRPVEEGKTYELQLTPDTTEKATVVTLTLRARLGAKENLFRTYATVQLPIPPPAGSLPMPTPSPAAPPRLTGE